MCHWPHCRLLWTPDLWTLISPFLLCRYAPMITFVPLIYIEIMESILALVLAVMVRCLVVGYSLQYGDAENGFCL